ncbi:MAG: formimidoylglutamase [Bacteroidales bacterium]|jgi:formiminoglutamase
MKKEIQDYLSPIDLNSFVKFKKETLGSSINIYSKENEFPKCESADIAIVGISEYRGLSKFNFSKAKNPVREKLNKAADYIRNEFYKLYNHFPKLKIIDVGNIKCGETVKDSYFALKTVVDYFISNNIFVIILGGSNDIAYANYLAYESLNKLINITFIDSTIDINEKDNCSSDSYINNIILKKPNFLFNITNIGYQTYFNNNKILKVFDSMFFDTFRLGIAQENMDEVEPSIRNSDIVNFDVSCIKASDSPGSFKLSPNGFTGNEVCKLCRFTGSSDRVSSLGIYEYNPLKDKNFITAKLIAQMMWYFLEGFDNRTKESPYKSDHFIKYHVNSSLFENDIVFYKSRLTSRWWMEVECPDILKKKFNNCYLVSCSYKDYLTACNNELPDRWIQVYKKIDIERI